MVPVTGIGEMVDAGLGQQGTLIVVDDGHRLHLHRMPLIEWDRQDASHAGGDRKRESTIRAMMGPPGLARTHLRRGCAASCRTADSGH
jgi:hypothetical protein